MDENMMKQGMDAMMKGMEMMHQGMSMGGMEGEEEQQPLNAPPVDIASVMKAKGMRR